MFRLAPLKAILATFIFGCLVLGFACSDDPKEPSKPDGVLELGVVQHGSCKTRTDLTAVGSAFPECIEWQYSDGVLSIHHLNAGFNCCVSALMASFGKEARAITITETENLDQGGCLCLCLYDLEYQLSYLAVDRYTFTIVGPYMEDATMPETDNLSFSIDLTAASSGSYCVERDHYPWQ